MNCSTMEEMGTIRHEMPPRRLLQPRTNRVVHFANMTSSGEVLSGPIPVASTTPFSLDDATNNLSPLIPWHMVKGQVQPPKNQAHGLMINGIGASSIRKAFPTKLCYETKAKQSTIQPPQLPSTSPPLLYTWQAPDELMVIGKSSKAVAPDESNNIMAVEHQQSFSISNSFVPISQEVATTSQNSTVKEPDKKRQTPSSRRSSSLPSQSSQSSIMVKQLLQDGQFTSLESPAPPPPSPEVHDFIGEVNDINASPSISVEITLNKSPSKSALNGADNSLLSVAEGEETDSEMTISAKPPSHLDSVSCIHSPRSFGNTRENSFMSRYNSGDMSNWGESRELESGLQERSMNNPDDDRNADLDQFEATNESLKQELKEEYEKLDKDNAGTVG